MYYSESTGSFYDAKINGDAIPADAIEISSEDHAALMAGQASGKRIVAGENGHPTLQEPPPPTQADIIADYERALDQHIDAAAHAKRYTDRFTFALRAGYPGPYHAEGVAFAQWMDDCNAQAYQLLQNVQAGTAPLPSREDFIASLPALVLP